jgi:hypothetical protein
MWRVIGLGLLVGFAAMCPQQHDSQPSHNSPPSQTPATSSQPAGAGQNSSAPSSGDSGASDPSESSPARRTSSDSGPPRSDRVNAADLGSDIGESSSKDTQIDLSPPADDLSKHPESQNALPDAEADADAAGGVVAEFHPWNPHKAAKNVEVGDFYFKRKNYHAAEDRYREALFYKENDAMATFKLAVCLEKMDRPEEALLEYGNYLKILPYGPEAGEARKAIDRLHAPATSAKKVK